MSYPLSPPSSYPYIVGSDFIAIVVDNRPFNINASHTFYEGIKAAIKSKDWGYIRQHIDVTRKIAAKVGAFEVDEHGAVFHKNVPIHNTITSKLLDMFREGYDIHPLLHFMELLDANPSRDSVGELYHFLEASGMPITEDGHILAYKSIRTDWKDVYTGMIDNSIGAVVKMERSAVTANRKVTCAPGLHFCSLKYLRDMNYGGCARVVIVKINPMNIVSVPDDYKDTKGRCCEYTVVGEVVDFQSVTKNATTDILRNQQVFTNEEVAEKFNGVQLSPPEPDEPFDILEAAAKVAKDAPEPVVVAEVGKNGQVMPKRGPGGHFLPNPNKSKRKRKKSVKNPQSSTKRNK